MCIHLFAVSLLLQFLCLQAFAEVRVRNVKTGGEVNPTLYSSQEGFVGLDQVNAVYGVEIILKGIELPANYKVVNADTPEQDFSFLKRYSMNKAETTAEGDGASAKGSSVTESPAKNAATDLIQSSVQPPAIRIVTGSPKTIIKDAAGNDLYVIEWTTEKRGILTRNCPPELLHLREVRNQQLAAGPLGVSCNFAMTPSLVTISAPKEVRWTSTNMMEVSGKGERYRTFEVPVGNLKGVASGVFRLSAEGKQLTYAVFVKKLDDKISTISIGFDKTFSFGINSASLSGGAASASSSSFYYEFEGLTDYIYQWVKLGFGFYNSFATGEDPSVVSSRDSKVTLGYYSNSKNAFNWGAWFGHANFDVKQDLSSTKFESSQFAIGADATYKISEKQKLIGRVEMASLGSKVVQSHLKLAVNYKYNLLIGKTEWHTGAVFETQTMKLVTADGSGRDYALTKMGLTLDF